MDVVLFRTWNRFPDMSQERSDWQESEVFFLILFFTGAGIYINGLCYLIESFVNYKQSI